MAKDENGLNLALETDPAEADEDVVDLLEVVKPGKTLSKASDADEDFSADLESMLDTLSKAEQAKAAEEGMQPFPDPTPVDHEVDPHESLAMPAMDDFDDILNALGASPPPAAENALDEQDALDMFPATPMPDLDAVPVAQSGAVATAPKTQDALPSEEDLLAELDPELNIDAPASASAPIPETTPVDLDGLPPGIDTADPPPMPVSSEEAPAGELQETDVPEEGDALSLDTAIGDIASESLDMKRAPEPAVPVAPDTEEDALPEPAEDSPDSPGGLRFDEVDLNELDALLDDMLASAPASGPGPTASPASEQAPAISGDSAAAEPGSELASLRMDMETLRRDLAATRPALRGEPSGSPSLEAKVEDMELTLHNLDSRITALESQHNELYANIDKLAAEAAAKIIREELAALLKAGI